MGGLVPLFPYMLYEHIADALPVSVVVSILALFAFGAFKGHFTGQKKFKAGLQTTIIGALAAGAAFMIASWIG